MRDRVRSIILQYKQMALNNALGAPRGSQSSPVGGEGLQAQSECEESPKKFQKDKKKKGNPCLEGPSLRDGDSDAHPKRIRKNVNYPFHMEQREGETHHAWHKRFFGVVAEVPEVTMCKTISAFQRGWKQGDFKKDLIVHSAQNLGDLSARERDI
ncbi:hypothetical protein CRG98_020992 [Punica granatum]|uniref:Uncharacterized protein n=1 Tax=Punica granatum TaxID=22663 RepID=A0A2I0JRT9_PUNGR|nr:hypothetical protein CRG98_020992 [Punica granatum]